jgi:hypothetical protein
VLAIRLASAGGDRGHQRVAACRSPDWRRPAATNASTRVGHPIGIGRHRGRLAARLFKLAPVLVSFPFTISAALNPLIFGARLASFLSDRLQVAWTFQSPQGCVSDQPAGGMDSRFLTRPYLLYIAVSSIGRLVAVMVIPHPATFDNQLSLLGRLVAATFSPYPDVPAFSRLVAVTFVLTRLVLRRVAATFSPHPFASSIDQLIGGCDFQSPPGCIFGRPTGGFDV